MALQFIDWIIIGVYLIITIALGLSYRKTAGKNLTGFFLGGRNLPWWIAGMSMVATTFAADTPLAVTELVAQNGIAGNWLWWCFLAGGMLTVFFFSQLWRRANILTEIEFIELRYSGKPAAFLRGFKGIYLGFFMNVLIIGWVNLAMVSIIQVFFDIPKNDALVYTALIMLFTAVYSSISGLLGVAITDTIQFIIAMSGCIVLAILVVNSNEVGGIDNLKNNLPEGALNFFPRVSASSAVETIKVLTISVGTFLAFIGVQWWASWYPGAEPGGGGYVAQRMMSTKNEKSALRSTLFFQIAHYCIRPWPWILVGLCSILLYPQLSEADKKLGYVYAMKDYLPAGLKGFLFVAFLSAYMSTISTQLNWGASYLVNDVYKRFIRKPAYFSDENRAEKNYVATSRITTIILMFISLAITTQLQTISGVWNFIIECGAGLGLVLILRWYWWRINAWSEIAATVAPLIAYAFSRFYLENHLGESFILNRGTFFVTVGFTTFVWILVTFITKPETENTLLNFYQRTMPGGWWKPVIQKTSAVIYEKTGGSEKMQVMQATPFRYLFMCWVSAIIMTYSVLFFTGKLIFHEWSATAIWFAIALAMFFILKYAMKKADL